MVSFTITYTVKIDKLSNTYHITKEINNIIEKSTLEELQEDMNKLRRK